jgi:hypothetical protein
MKTWDEIVEWLEGRGYRSDGMEQDGCTYKQLFWQRVVDPKYPCVTNEHLQIAIDLWEFHSIPNSPNHTTASIEIRAEGPDGVWYTLSAYSLNPDELVSKHDATIERLIRAWNAVHEE